MSKVTVPPAIARIAPDGNLTPRQKRRFMIDMILRRMRPGTGSGHDFLRRRTAMNPWPDLRPILQGIDWVVIGGVATRAYMPERMTKDLDILVHERDGEAAVKKLEGAGYRKAARLAVPGYQMVSPDGVEVDVLLGSYKWLKEALGNPGSDAAGYPVVRLPYLVLLKLAAQRAQDLADVSRMLGWAAERDLEEVRAAVRRHAPEDLEDLESLIFIGKNETQSPPSGEE